MDTNDTNQIPSHLVTSTRDLPFSLDEHYLKYKLLDYSYGDELSPMNRLLYYQKLMKLEQTCEITNCEAWLKTIPDMLKINQSFIRNLVVENPLIKFLSLPAYSQYFENTLLLGYLIENYSLLESRRTRSTTAVGTTFSFKVDKILSQLLFDGSPIGKRFMNRFIMFRPINPMNCRSPTEFIQFCNFAKTNLARDFSRQPFGVMMLPHDTNWYLQKYLEMVPTMDIRFMHEQIRYVTAARDKLWLIYKLLLLSFLSRIDEKTFREFSSTSGNQKQFACNLFDRLSDIPSFIKFVKFIGKDDLVISNFRLGHGTSDGHSEITQQRRKRPRRRRPRFVRRILKSLSDGDRRQDILREVSDHYRQDENPNCALQDDDNDGDVIIMCSDSTVPLSDGTIPENQTEISSSVVGSCRREIAAMTGKEVALEPSSTFNTDVSLTERSPSPEIIASTELQLVRLLENIGKAEVDISDVQRCSKSYIKSLDADLGTGNGLVANLKNFDKIVENFINTTLWNDTSDFVIRKIIQFSFFLTSLMDSSLNWNLIDEEHGDAEFDFFYMTIWKQIHRLIWHLIPPNSEENDNIMLKVLLSKYHNKEPVLYILELIQKWKWNLIHHIRELPTWRYEDLDTICGKMCSILKPFDVERPYYQCSSQFCEKADELLYSIDLSHFSLDNFGIDRLEYENLSPRKYPSKEAIKK